jgi:glycosyltransferase involved in cell wall biosynthesis
MSDSLQIVVDGVIYQYQSTGGISRLFTEILPRMCALDNEVLMTIFTSGALCQALPEHPRITHQFLPRFDPLLKPAVIWPYLEDKVRQIMLRLFIGKGRGKIWHSTYFTQPDPWDGLKVVTVADMIYEKFPDLYRGFYSHRFRVLRKRCVLAADAVLCISEATRDDVRDFYGISPDRLHVVHLAHSDFFRPLVHAEQLLPSPVRTPFFLYVGSRTHHKNFTDLIKAFSRWKGPDKARLLVVGAPWSLSESRLLAELGVNDMVDLWTHVDDTLLCALYNQASAFIYPSIYEGFGIPLLEAMACGCPVIASRIATTVEITGDCPIYFEIDQTDSLVCAFDTVLGEGRGSPRVRAGLEHTKNFSWDKTASGTLDVYRLLS